MRYFELQRSKQFSIKLSMERKTRRTKQILRNREIILSAARTLFLNKGVRSTTMGDIAKQAGFDRRTVYNHFKNKEDILSSLIAGVLNKMSEAYERISETDASTFNKLRSLVLELLDIYIDNSEILNIFIPEYESGINNKQSRAVSTFMLKNIHEYREIESKLINIIQKAQDENLIIDVHPYILAGLLNELLLRSVFVWRNHGKDMNKQDIIRDIIRVIQGNLLRKPFHEELS
ncbi:MAG: hypothetical protein DRG37_01290 [Deltaproteobacteria bacterium]|nr:MAG: hypothetical protein DRG37_01290 [Deltaproteobacteria bacterium]